MCIGNEALMAQNFNRAHIPEILEMTSSMFQFAPGDAVEFHSIDSFKFITAKHGKVNFMRY